MSDELRAAIVQDDATGRVLMLGWMDEEALALTRSSGLVHFFSRSRQKLWRKGETSGNAMHVVEVLPDCDEDAVLVRVNGRRPGLPRRLDVVFHAVAVAKDPSDGSKTRPGGRTSWIYSTTGPRRARKVGEEAVELVVAALSEDDERVVE